MGLGWKVALSNNEDKELSVHTNCPNDDDDEELAQVREKVREY